MRSTPTEPDHEADDQSWVPFIGGLLGLVGGAAIGWFVARDDGRDTAAALAVIGGFMGLVLVVVPLTSRGASREETRERSERVPFWSRTTTTMRIPPGGLLTRPVPNRNADPTGRVDGGREVTIVRRSGKWARITDGEDGQPRWVARRDLEPLASDDSHEVP